MTNLEAIDVKTIGELPYRWDALSNKTILISGGTGFLGSFFIDVIRYRNKEHQDNVKIVSLSRRGGKSDNTVTYLPTDITQPIELDESVDYVVHLASNTHPLQYGLDPVGTITTNVLGCFNLLELSRKLKAQKFLLASSVEIYGQGNEKPMDENYSGYIDPNSARSGYNESKRVCEALCRSYFQQYGVECVIARFSRIFGPDRKNDSKAMAQFMDCAVNGKNIVLTSMGNQHYSYCYVADAVSALFKLLLDGKNNESYNVSADDEGLTLGDYASLISKFAGTQVEYKIEENPNASKITYALLDTKKLKTLGWTPCYDVTEALERTYHILSSR